MSENRRRSARIQALDKTPTEETSEKKVAVKVNRKRLSAQGSSSVEPKKKTPTVKESKKSKSVTTTPVETSKTTPRRPRTARLTKATAAEKETAGEIEKTNEKSRSIPKRPPRRTQTSKPNTHTVDTNRSKSKETPPSRPQSRAQVKRAAALKAKEENGINEEIVTPKRLRSSLKKSEHLEQQLNDTIEAGAKIDKTATTGGRNVERKKEDTAEECDIRGGWEDDNGEVKNAANSRDLDEDMNREQHRTTTPMSDQNAWVEFGNSSDDEAKDKKTEKQGGVSPHDRKTPQSDVSSHPSSGRPQRAKAPKSFIFRDDKIDDSDFSSSSEDESSSSDGEGRDYKKGKKSSPESEEPSRGTEEEEEESSNAVESDEGIISKSVVKKKVQRKRVSGGNSSTSRPNSRATPVQRYRSGCDVVVKGAKSTSLHGPRNFHAKTTSLSGPSLLAKSQAREQEVGRKSTSSPDIEELKKRAACHVTTITAGPRKESRGEKIMRELRRVAQSLAVNRTEEFTTDECAVIMNQLKEKYKKGCSTKSAHVNDANEVKPKGDEGSSSSEDEWEEMELVEEEAKKHVQVTIGKFEKGAEVDWAVKWLRCELNKSIREAYENAHRMHLLCWMFYLQYQVKCALDEELVTSLALTQMPSGFSECCGNPLSEKTAEKFVKWMYSAFKLSKSAVITSKEEFDCRYPDTARYAKCVQEKVFETDLDRAIMFFISFAALEVPVRLVCNCRVMGKKIGNQDELRKKSPKSTQSAKGKSKKNEKDRKNVDEKKEKKDVLKEDLRDYWIEWWSLAQRKWICIDPVTGEIDKPANFENKMSKPPLYIFACDSKFGIRDVGARYLSSFATPDYRRNRTQQDWLSRVLRMKRLRASAERARLEDLSFQNDIASRPLPTSLAEYKDHPLYVLEKDLLKFQGIYPSLTDQKPIGEVRGHKVYPRSTVYTLQGELNWIKVARSVKEGELPYKVVKARPNMRIPADQRGEPPELNLYGFWQTEPYRTPVVVDGKIPVNKYGNIYVYQDSMVPMGTVHLKMNGIINICKRLDKEHAVAVVGWDFHGASNHPILEGACVLEKDVEELIEEWEKAEARRQEREEKKRQERVSSNWKKLIRGSLRLHYMNKQFANVGDRKEEDSDDLQNEQTESDIKVEVEAAWPAPKFTLQNIEGNE